MRPHRRQLTRLPRPWDSPGKNTGVGCHFPLQCMKVKSESEVSQSCPTLRNPMDCSLPVSSVHGIFQARVLEWGAIAFSKETDCKVLKAILGPYSTPHFHPKNEHNDIDEGFPFSKEDIWWVRMEIIFVKYQWLFGEGTGNPCQYFCLENPMDRGDWWVTDHGVTKSRTQLS